MVSILILGNLQYSPLFPLGGRVGQKVIDELIVDLSKGDPDGELLVIETIQLNGRLIMLELSETSTWQVMCMYNCHSILTSYKYYIYYMHHYNMKCVYQRLN